MKVLVVDDAAELRGVLHEYLEAVGHDVVPAASGREAIVEISEHDFDVAVVDWQMAGISGRDVIHHLRSVSPSTRIFVSTGYGESMVSTSSLEGLVEAVFRKPFSLSDLARSLVEGKPLAPPASRA